MQKAAAIIYMPAVEMAEYLTENGMPFREAHEITGKIVRECEGKKSFSPTCQSKN
jgi:argininosuccinate lyase